MAETMRQFLESIRKDLEKNPKMLDAPVFSVHGASGSWEQISAPSVFETADDEEMLDIFAGEIEEGQPYWRFYLGD